MADLGLQLMSSSTEFQVPFSCGPAVSEFHNHGRIWNHPLEPVGGSHWPPLGSAFPTGTGLP